MRPFQREIKPSVEPGFIDHGAAKRQRPLQSFGKRARQHIHGHIAGTQQKRRALSRLARANGKQRENRGDPQQGMGRVYRKEGRRHGEPVSAPACRPLQA